MVKSKTNPKTELKSSRDFQNEGFAWEFVRRAL